MKSFTRTIPIIMLLVCVVFMGSFQTTDAAGNFGNDHAGASYTDVAVNEIIAGKWTLGGVEQYTDTVRFYGRSPDVSPHNGKAIICDSSLNIIAIGDPSAISNSNEWQTLTFSSNVTLEASTAYYVGLISDFASRVYYDTTGDYVIDTTNSYASPTDPTDGGTDTTREYSIYAVTYDDQPDTRSAISGSFDGTGEINSWPATRTKDSIDWYGDPYSTLTLNFTIQDNTTYFEYHLYAYMAGNIGDTTIRVYNFVSASWDSLQQMTVTPTWYNDTVSNPDHMDTVNKLVMLRLNATSDGSKYPKLDYADITIFDEPLPIWNEIGEAEFILPVEWDPIATFGYDMFFIVLGLIMIPTSTMYLVRGGREEMSSDKIFYGLILFLVGIGLVIGGVMP